MDRSEAERALDGALRVSAIILLLLLLSCTSVDSKVDVGREGEIVGGAAGVIRGEAQSISAAAEDGKAQAPALPHWASIIDHAGIIMAQATAIADASTRLAEAQKLIDAREKECVKLRDEVRREAARKWLAFAVGGGALITVGVILMVLSSRFTLLALAIMAGGGAAMGIGTFMNLSAWVLTIVVSGIVVLVGVIVGWTIWRRFVDDRKDAAQVADLIHDAWIDRTPLEAVIASLRTSWNAFGKEWKRITAEARA